MSKVWSLAIPLLLSAGSAWPKNADFDGDGRVDLGDFFLFRDHYNQPVEESNRRFDLNDDGRVNIDDFMNLVEQFGGPAALDPMTPEALRAALQALPQRLGPQPEQTYRIPHLQLSQIAPSAMYDQLDVSVACLSGLEVRPAQFLEPGRSWHLILGLEGGPDRQRYANGGSIGHLHSRSQGSMHLLLPKELFRQIILPRGWGVLHPFSALLGVGTPNADFAMIWARPTPLLSWPENWPNGAMLYLLVKA